MLNFNLPDSRVVEKKLITRLVIRASEMRFLLQLRQCGFIGLLHSPPFLRLLQTDRESD